MYYLLYCVLIRVKKKQPNNTLLNVIVTITMQLTDSVIVGNMKNIDL